MKMFGKTTWITFKRSVGYIVRHWNDLSRSQLHFSIAASGFGSDQKTGEWLIGKGNTAKAASNPTTCGFRKSLTIIKIRKRDMVAEACIQVTLFNKTHKLNQRSNVLWVRVGVMSALSTEEQALSSFHCDHFPKNIFFCFFPSQRTFF